MFSLFQWLGEKLGMSPSFVEHYLHVFTSIFVALVITLMSVLAWRKLQQTDERVVPEKRPTLSGIFELVVELLLGLMRDVMGPRADSYFPLIGALFIYILISNLLGVIPGFVPPTDNINTNVACALTVFLYYNAVGIKEQGIKKYFSHMFGPVKSLPILLIPIIPPVIFVIEIISHIVRPVSLSIRLFGNMTGDHLVLEIFSNLIPLGVPMIFMGLGIFISFIQAFVFSLLSIVYIALATEQEAH